MMNFSQYNESVRDMMTPKSIDDIKKKLDNPDDLLELFEYGCKKKQGFIIKYALDNGLDIHIEDDSPLRIACKYDCRNTVRILLERGADVHAANDDALMWAFELKDKFIVDLLLKYGAKIPDINESIRDHMTPKSREDIIQSLSHLTPQQKFEMGIEKEIIWLIEHGLSEGADPNFYKKVKTLGYLLENDIGTKKKEIIELLIKHNINIHFRDEALLIWAIKHGYVNMIKRLLKMGANVNAQKGEPLMWTCNLERPDLVQLLIDNKADVTLYPNILGNYAEYGYMEIVEMLLSNGEFLQGEKDRALRHACFRGHLSTIKVLVKYGADIHTGNDAPVMISALNNQIDLVKYFVSMGADVQCQKNMPLQRAAHYGHIEMIELLISYGANILDDNNATLVEAVSQGQLQTVKLLLKLGANANDVSRHTLEHINTNKEAIVRLIKQHQWYERDIKKTNESLRDKMTPKSEDEMRKELSKLRPEARILEGIEYSLIWVIEDCINEGVDINKWIQLREMHTFGEVNSYLEFACYIGDIDVIKFLLEKGATKSNYRRKVCMDNIRYFHDEKYKEVNELLKQYEKTNESLKDKMTPISPKDIIRNFEKIDGLDFIKIIEANLDEDFTDEELINKIKTFSKMDLTMNFQHSIGYNKVRLVELFLKAGADLHYNKDWPIYYAAGHGFSEILTLLIDLGADPNSDNGTPIYAALTGGQYQCLDILLNSGGNFDRFLNEPSLKKYVDEYLKYKKINESVRALMTPKSEEDIMKSFSKFHPVDMITRGVGNGILSLVKKGVEILTKQSEDDIGEVVQILQNNLRNSYFTKAVERRYMEVVEYLLEVGFEPSENNMTWTCTNGSIDMIKILIKYGSVVDDRLIEHVTKYRSENIEEVLALLQKHNKDRVINKIKKRRWF